MDRRHPGRITGPLLLLALAGCAPSLAGLAAASGDGASDPTVVNPTLVATVDAYVASSTTTVLITTTPAGQPLEASVDGGGFVDVSTTWTISGLAEGAHTARIRVRGSDASEQEVAWVNDTIPPTAPSGVTLSAARAGEIDVSWSAGSDSGSGLHTYTVLYGTASGSPSSQDSSPAPIDGVTLDGLDPCQIYFVTVHCTDRAGNTSSATAETSARANCGGDGTFTSTTLTLDHGPSTIARGDFNGDGILDLAVDADDHLQILLGNGAAGEGNGTFTLGESYDTGSTIAEIAVADVTADGILDIVLVNETNLKAYRGDGSNGLGDGTFTIQSSTSTNLSTPQALIVRDFDADAILDAVVGDWGSDALLTFQGGGTNGRGDGTFAYVGSVATGARPGAIAAGDFNADGIADLAVACQGGTEVLVTHLGNGSNGRGNGAFAAMHTWLSGGFVAGDVLIADHNGDGIDDLVATLALANSVCFLAGSGTNGRGTGVFYLDEVVGVGTRPWGLVAADFTGDSILDFVSLSYLQAGATLIHSAGEHGRGNGNFTTSNAGGSGHSMFRGVTGDIDGNGSPDLVLGDLSGSLQILTGNGSQPTPDGGFEDRGLDLWTLGTVQGVCAADRNSDNIPDLLVASFQSPYAGGNDFVTSWLNDEADGLGLGTFTGGGSLITVGSGPVTSAVGDFDRDHITDAAVLAADLDMRGGGNRLDVLLGSGSSGVGTGSVSSTNNTSVGTSPRDLVVADFNADAILDVAVTNHGTDTVTILIGQGSSGRGDGTFTALASIATDAGPFCIAGGDLNRDGIIDLVVGCTNGTGTGSLQVLLGQGTSGIGTGLFTATTATPTANAITDLALTDVNADAILDVVFTQYRFGGSTSTSGIIAALGSGSDGRGDGTFTIGAEVAIGGNPRALVVCDLDQDGIQDVVVTDSDAAVVKVLRGSGSHGRGDGTFGSPESIAVAEPGTAIACGDLDSDGMVDLIVAGNDRVSLRFATY